LAPCAAGSDAADAASGGDDAPAGAAGAEGGGEAAPLRVEGRREDTGAGEAERAPLETSAAAAAAVLSSSLGGADAEDERFAPVEEEGGIPLPDRLAFDRLYSSH